MSAIVPQDTNEDKFKEYLDKAGVLEFLTVTVSAKVSQDLNNEEFKEYLDKAGVLEFLSLVLVTLYEEPEKPSDALDYIKNSTGGAKADKEEINKLSYENHNLKIKIEELEKTEAELKKKLMEATTLTASKTEDTRAIDDTAEVSATNLRESPINITNLISLFPDELLDTLFSLLSRHDRKSVVMVCKRWNTIGEGPHLWTWVKFLVTSGNLADMPEILGVSRLAKVGEIVLDEAISKEVLLAMDKHQGLDVLRVFKCNVSDIDSDLLARVITGIEEVSLEYTKLEEKQWNAVFNSTKGAKLKKLSIDGFWVDLTLANPEPLAEAVSTLERVKLNCKLTAEQSKAMFDRLAVKSKLKSLEIRTDLSSVAVESLAMVVSQVEEATLYFNLLTTQQITAIFIKATQEDSQLKVLNLFLNNLSQVDPHVMATALNKMDKVGLSYGDLNATQYSAIFGLAAGNSKLKDLDIRGNDLSSVNKHDMAGAVSKLEKIDLEYTRLTNQQCSQIFKCAENESNLKVLKIGRNDLSAVEPGSMARAVSKMEECSLKWSELTSQQLEDIFKHINEDCTLKNLDMAGNNLSSVEADILCKTVANLYEVNLGTTRLTTAQLEAIFMAIKRSTKIKILKLQRVDLRSVQTETLVGALSCLEEVDLSWAELTPQQVAAVKSIPGDCRIKGL